MMRKDIFLPGLAIVGGLLGLGLRLWQWSTGYNPETQLFVHGHPAVFLLMILLTTLVFVFLFLLRDSQAPKDPLSVFRCPSSGYMAGMAASAMLFLGAGVLGLIEGMEQLSLWRSDPTSHLLTYPVSLILCALLAFVAGPATLLAGKGAYRGNPPPICSLLIVFPPLSALAWLFATHLAHGTDPILMGYGFLLAAVALLMLSHYDIAAFFHCRPHPRRTAFCALLGTTLGITSLADSLTPFQMALTAAFVLSAISSTYAMLHNIFGPAHPKRLIDERMPRGAQDETANGE